MKRALSAGVVGDGAGDGPKRAVAKLVGLSGKTEMDGAEVEGEYERGNLAGIAEYCMADVALTYLVFLQCQRMRGLLRPDPEAARAEALEYFRGQVAARPFLADLVQALERRAPPAPHT